ncbi:hypothetical protein AB0O18_31110 [Streptomyces sp. NPDC093224]|uniref:hypothetical protein n=1 Tax=Streptomyces sp. NPDC093224 TaxID=3155198 RepID=UPI003426C684
MFAARALVAVVLTAATVTPMASASSAREATPPAASHRVAAPAPGGQGVVGLHGGQASR